MLDRSMWGGDDYDFLMGRWSRLMAPLLVQYADVQDGDDVLDIGCGTGSRIDTWCHGWGKKKAPPKWGFQPRCPLSCELGLLYPQEQNFLVVSPMDRR